MSDQPPGGITRRRLASSPAPRSAPPLVDPNELAGALLELGSLRLERDAAVRELASIRAELDEVKEALARISRETDTEQRADPTKDPTP